MNVFLSYCWKEENIASEIAELFSSLLAQDEVLLIRDKDRLSFMEDIKKFMQSIKHNDYSVLIISDSYLKSENCMFEISELMKLDDYEKRILVLCKSDANIFDFSSRLHYIEFWQNIFDTRETEIKKAKVSDSNKVEVLVNLRKIENIKNNISPFLEKISQLMLINFSGGFKYEEFLKMSTFLNLSINNKDSYYLLSITKTLNYWNGELIWWSKKDRYTNKVSAARIFSKEEVNKLLYETWGCKWEKKIYVAVPIELVRSFKLEVIPSSSSYVERIKKNRQSLLGNVDIYLTKEELKMYG